MIINVKDDMDATYINPLSPYPQSPYPRRITPNNGWSTTYVNTALVPYTYYDYGKDIKIYEVDGRDVDEETISVNFDGSNLHVSASKKFSTKIIEPIADPYSKPLHPINLKIVLGTGCEIVGAEFITGIIRVMVRYPTDKPLTNIPLSR